MKTKAIVSLTMAALLASATAVTAYAGSLTETNQSGSTEVTAHINGNNPGTVAYEISIPDVVDFGELHQPATNDDSYVDAPYTLELVTVSGLQASEKIAVYVKDEKAKVGDDEEFRITNKSNSAISFNYDVYDVTDIQNSTASINSGTMTSAGFPLWSCTTVGEKLEGKLRLNENELYGQNLIDLVGEYSGYMVFFSQIETI